MSAWDKEIDLGTRTSVLVGALASLVVVAWCVVLGLRARGEPQRCTPGLVIQEHRCCAKGQGLSEGRCVGAPTSCPEGFQLVTGEHPGCVFMGRKIKIEGGSVTLGPVDWDSADVVQRHTIFVRTFFMDQTEVTHHAYQRCVTEGACEERNGPFEPGQPVSHLSVDEARRYCAFAGGRLPTSPEWVFAASGSEARRYPWGPHGLVCRRASFGLRDGPCAEGARGPELSGARLAGRSPEELLDMAGNVAEWTWDPGDGAYLRGGSYRSKLANSLKVWAQRRTQPGDATGFRCVYPDIP